MTRRSLDDSEAAELARVGSLVLSARVRRLGPQSRRKLARLAGVSETSIRTLENGAGSSLLTLVRVCRAMDCPLAEVVRAPET